MEQPLSLELIKRLSKWPSLQDSVMKNNMVETDNSADQANSEDANEEATSESMEEENPALDGHFLTERSTLDITILDSCVCKCHRDQTMTFELTLPFSCSKCSQQFCCKCQFLVHREFHRGERKYECDVCGKSYYYKSDLVRHQPVHSQVKPHVCKVCGRSFNQVGHLITHKLVHTGEKPFSCDVCHKPFNRKSNLQKHKMIHTGERPFHCIICESKFSRKGDLQRHTMLHTGERPYKCDVCEKTFSQKPHLVSHTAVHTGERPYKCLACGRSFNRKNHLLKHQVDKCPELSLKPNQLSLSDFTNLSSNSFFNNFNHLLVNKAELETSDESTVEKSYFDSVDLKSKIAAEIVSRSKSLPGSNKSKDRCKHSTITSLLRARLSDPSYARSSSENNSNKQNESTEIGVRTMHVKSEIGVESDISEESSLEYLPEGKKQEPASKCEGTKFTEGLSSNKVTNTGTDVARFLSEDLKNSQPSSSKQV